MARRNAMNPRARCTFHQITQTDSQGENLRACTTVAPVAIKNSVLRLPKRDQNGRISRILCEVAEGGGEAFPCARRASRGPSDVRRRRVSGRRELCRKYAFVADEARELRQEAPSAPRVEDARANDTDGMRLTTTALSEVARLSPFDRSDGKRRRGSYQALEAVSVRGQCRASRLGEDLDDYRQRCWVHSQGDSYRFGWEEKAHHALHRPRAKFKFVPARGYRPEKGEIRFDLFLPNHARGRSVAHSRFLIFLPACVPQVGGCGRARRSCTTSI